MSEPQFCGFLIGARCSAGFRVDLDLFRVALQTEHQFLMPSEEGAEFPIENEDQLIRLSLLIPEHPQGCNWNQPGWKNKVTRVMNVDRYGVRHR